MNRLPGIAAVALIVVGSATSSASLGSAGGLANSSVAATVSSPVPLAKLSQLPIAPAAEQEELPPKVDIRDASISPESPILPGPARIRYPAIKADMIATEVGVAEGGLMEIPEDAGIAGWYRYSAAPAEESGSTIIAAHAGSLSTPRGPLYDLRVSRVGQSIEIIDTKGAVTLWKVATVEQIHKETLDLTPYFSQTGVRKLVLFTCGGRWDSSRQSYDDNIIVTAVPAG